MIELTEMSCVRPDGDSKLSEEKIESLRKQVPGWDLEEEDGIPQLQRTFEFKNFAQALSFTNKVGELAEREDHHPSILTEWGKVTVTFWTHKVNGLHLNDFIAAAKTDQIYK